MQGVYDEFFSALINKNATATAAYNAAEGKLCRANAVLRDGKNEASELNCAAGGDWIYMYMYRAMPDSSALASIFTSPSGAVLISFAVLIPAAVITAVIVKKKQAAKRKGA